jgi:hypothetical protein
VERLVDEDDVALVIVVIDDRRLLLDLDAVAVELLAAHGGAHALWEKKAGPEA